jgi:hypothetical protein
MQDLLTRGIDKHGQIHSEATHEFKNSLLGRVGGSKIRTVINHCKEHQAANAQKSPDAGFAKWTNRYG